MSENSKKNYFKLIELVKDRNIHIGSHWDADGVTSGALIYHLIKDYAKNITYHSKGEVFKIENEEIPENTDLVISTDIQTDKLNYPLIYIDHHPIESENMLNNEILFQIHNIDSQSCSLLIYNQFIKENLKIFEFHEIKYLLFLTLLGYFGDAGKIENIPIDLYVLAKEMMPELMKVKQGYKPYLEIERFVSLFNVSKRVHWDGELALKALIKNSDYESIIYLHDPYIKELYEHKMLLRQDYEIPVSFTDLGCIKYSVIEHEKNIQGVLCARYMDDKPILIINTSRDRIVGSMRVPDNLDFDAGKFLEDFNKILDSAHAGGHEKAGGISFEESDLSKFIKILREKAYQLNEKLLSN